MEQRADQGILQRRFARRQTLIGGGLVLSGLAAAALVGCGSDSSGDTTTTTSTSTNTGSAKQVRRGGRLQLADIPQTQDFHRHSGTMPTPSLVSDTPTAMDAEGKTQNFLLEKFEAPDASNYVFTFKAGIKFHNGRELTSEDVRLNLDRIKNTKGAWLKSLAERISSMSTRTAGRSR